MGLLLVVRWEKKTNKKDSMWGKSKKIPILLNRISFIRITVAESETSAALFSFAVFLYNWHVNGSRIRSTPPHLPPLLSAAPPPTPPPPITHTEPSPSPNTSVVSNLVLTPLDPHKQGTHPPTHFGPSGDPLPSNRLRKISCCTRLPPSKHTHMPS